MTTQVAARTSDARSDARLAFGVASASAVAFILFVVAPFYAPSLWQLPGEELWLLGALTGIFLAPVAAGLAAWASFVALWSHGDALPGSSRRLHLSTLAVAAALLLTLVSPWGFELTAWLRD
jgi:hypothetical protein